MSELIFKYGTMSSGKSLHLLSTAHNFKENNIKYQLLKPSIDNRTIGTIHSRIGVAENCTSIQINQNVWDVIDLNINCQLYQKPKNDICAVSGKPLRAPTSLSAVITALEAPVLA